LPPPGVNGKKQWLEAAEIGQEVQFTVYPTGSTLAVEHYEHDNLPMGLVRVSTALQPIGEEAAVPTAQELPPVMLDGRCSDCVLGQGFYKLKVVAENIPPGQRATVRLTVVPREDQKEGYKFSLVSLISY
jgi:hypothetical protein